jgi:hypothetical protein
MDTYWLDDLLTYARCPMEWFWEKRAGAPKPATPRGLIPGALRQAIAFYGKGHAESLKVAVEWVWQDWCAAWGDRSILDNLKRYSGGRAAVLRQFESGRITRPDGSRYLAPRMTSEYRRRMGEAGLMDLGRRLDGFARQLGLALPEGYGPGSAFGDAFADSWHMAERASIAEAKWPGRETVLGWHVPFAVSLGNGLRVVGKADLVLRPPPNAEAGEVILEIHDYHSLPIVGANAAARDLRVIAASLAEPLSPAEAAGNGSALTWHTVSHVVYRHLPGGQAFIIREVSPGRLLAVVSTVARAIRSQVVIPRLLTSPVDCQACPYRERCFSGQGWDALDLLDPTTLARAEQLLAAVKSARQALKSDRQASRLAINALQSLEANLRRDMPDVAGMMETLAEVRSALEAQTGEGAP